MDRETTAHESDLALECCRYVEDFQLILTIVMETLEGATHELLI